VLADSYWNGPSLPDRIGRALCRVESVTRERYLEDALPLVVGGLESLVKIGRELKPRSSASVCPRSPATSAFR